MDQMLSRWQPTALSLFRFITGLLLFQYGVAKLFKFPAGTMFEKVELFSLIGAAGTLELVLGGLLMIGLYSRGDPVLLCLSLFVDRRGRAVQRRRDDGQEGLTTDLTQQTRAVRSAGLLCASCR